MRKIIYTIIEPGSQDTGISSFYDIFMFLTIIVSLIPLATKSTARIFSLMDSVTVTIFTIDYLLRLLTADLKLGKGFRSFLKYPFTFMGIVDLLSILPSLIPISNGWKVFKIFRAGRTLQTFKVLKFFKTIRYSQSIQIIFNVFQRQRDSLIIVCWFAVTYILISALIIFNVEPNTFPTFFDAVYWAVVSLTTVGYGDVSCTSVVGKLITMVSAFFGIAVVALPAGIITAGYVEEVYQKNGD